MKLARHDLVAALSLRYDHYSSQSLFEAACKRANLGDQEHYTAAEVTAFRAALAKLGDRLQRVDDRLESLLGVGATEPSTPAPVHAPAPISIPSAKERESATVSAETASAESAKTTSAETASAETVSAESEETRVVLTGIELADGDALFVCGDCGELGNWDPERARPMMRDGDDWIAVVPRGEGSFKFLRRTEDGEVTWEAGENREIGTAVQIETSWQSSSL